MEITQINTALNLAFPVRWAERIIEKDGKPDTVVEPLVWAYHTPISREIFDANYRIISAANMEIFSKGVAFAAESGPIIAALALRDASRQRALELGIIDENTDPGTALMLELKRLTMILAPGATGFEYLPVDIALQKKVIDADDWREAESSVAFFTCGLWMARRTIREVRREALALVLRGLITSLQPMEFVASLRTLNPAETSEPTPQLSVAS
jgi:hypothetical protein